MMNKQAILDDIFNSYNAARSDEKIKRLCHNDFQLKKYYKIGELLFHLENEYGFNEKDFIKMANELKKEMKIDVPQDELIQIKKFYIFITFKYGGAIRPNIGWEQYKLIMKIKSYKKIDIIINKCIVEDYTPDQLKEYIDQLKMT